MTTQTYNPRQIPPKDGQQVFFKKKSCSIIFVGVYKKCRSINDIQKGIQGYFVYINELFQNDIANVYTDSMYDVEKWQPIIFPEF